MKKVLLCADSEISIFSVPDTVADNLEKYCLEFCTHWLLESPYAEKYRVEKSGKTVGVCYSKMDFIDYLNQYICKEQSVLVATLTGILNKADLPKEYSGLPYFGF